MDEQLLDTIYAAAAIPELWKDVLDRISAMAGGHAGALIAIRNGELPRYVVTESYGGDLFPRIFQTGISNQNVRPVRALASYPMGFSTDLELCSEQELEVDPIYRDGLRPNGFEWTAGTAVPVPSGDIMLFDLARRSGTGPFDRANMEAIDPYRPHLARSALMAARLELAQARATAEALERMGLPAATVTPTGKVIAANALFPGPSARLRIAAFDRLEAVDRSVDEMLRRALKDELPVVRSLPIPATTEEPALIVHVMPVRKAANDIFARSSAVIVVTPVTAPDAPLTGVISGLFDLTTAEARVAGGIAAGLTVQQIADGSAVSPQTVRTQLKTVFSKTGTTRQTDLALLLSGARSLER